MRSTLPACLLAALLIGLGCSEDLYLGQMVENQPPTVWLTSSPPEGDTTLYHIEFYWLGDDPDGTVSYYEFTLAAGNPIGFDPADTTGPDKWTRTIRCDTVLKVSADKFDTTVTINNSLYGKFTKTHTFFLRAVDNRGKRSEPAHCSFTAFTLAPAAFIDFPQNPNPGQTQYLNPIIYFRWSGKDPIDAPWNYQDVDSARYLMEMFETRSIYNLNKHPEMYEDCWSPWMWYDAPTDSGKETIIGDDEILEINRMYFFAVQAKDDAGAVSSVFDEHSNVRVFTPIEQKGPRLFVWEPYLGSFQYLGINYTPYSMRVMEGFPLKFRWAASASHYGGFIASYRYGWDIEDLGKPTDWDVFPSPDITSHPPKKFYMGLHTLYIEVADNFGMKTLGQIEVEIYPKSMNRNLLWVDDFPSNEFEQKYYAIPTESAHDKFWLDILSRAEGFLPDRDVYDCAEIHRIPPDVPDQELIFQYRNIIWTYTSEERVSAWDNVVGFTRASSIDMMMSTARLNYLEIFLQSGGHLWTLGKSDRRGGLAGVLPAGGYGFTTAFPHYVKCELFGVGEGCTDTIGVQSMVYKDYCVSVIDKVVGNLRIDMDMPYRTIDRDAMSWGFKDTSDPITASHPELPDRLDLWSKVTEPEKYFDPMDKGFTYVEIYDPAYWIEHIMVTPQRCIHPMYRMRARNTNSPLNNTIIAFWTSKYADVVAESPGAIAAPSVHFGFPLWFFNRQQAAAMADAIFNEWQIGIYSPSDDTYE